MALAGRKSQPQDGCGLLVSPGQHDIKLEAETQAGTTLMMGIVAKRAAKPKATGPQRRMMGGEGRIASAWAKAVPPTSFRTSNAKSIKYCSGDGDLI